MARLTAHSLKFTPQLRAWIDAHVALGEFPDAGSCVEDAFKRLQELNTEESLGDAIKTGQRSGKARPYTKDDWQRLHEDARRFVSAYHASLARRRTA